MSDQARALAFSTAKSCSNRAGVEERLGLGDLIGTLGSGLTHASGLSFLPSNLQEARPFQAGLE